MLTRRRFLGRLSTGAAILAAHEVLGQTRPATQPATEPSPHLDLNPRILTVRLKTATPLEEMRKFYQDRLGFKVFNATDSQITFSAGLTLLQFTAVSSDELHGDGGRGKGEPVYHFAFNIHPDLLPAARTWQLKRTPLVAPRENLRDPDYPQDVWHFRHWNAHSIFFFDPACNIVEYIARHDIGHAPSRDPDAFTTENLLYISELGFVFDDEGSGKAARKLQEKLKLNEYPRGSQPWAMGDERGLLLCLARKGQSWGDNTDTPVKWDVFPTECTIMNRAFHGRFMFDSHPYAVLVK